MEFTRFNAKVQAMSAVIEQALDDPIPATKLFLPIPVLALSLSHLVVTLMI
jgi:hypothetical protein